MKGIATTKLRRVGLILLVGSFLLAGAQLTTPETSAAKITWGLATGTIYFNRAETKDFATLSLGSGGICASIYSKLKDAKKNPYVLVGLASCEAYSAVLWVQANRAHDRQMCLKIKYAPVPYGGVVWYPDIYRGDYCR